MRSNCILFAVGLYIRRGSERRIVTVDGIRYFVLWRSGRRHILIRPSRLGGWIPHMLYAERRWYGLRIVHFVPTDKRPKTLPPPLFSGGSKWGDLPEDR
jgi:hypothetical protein